MIPEDPVHPLNEDDVEVVNETYYKRCEECGGQMEWCDTCQMWSRTCCEEFGSCQCS